MAYLALLFADYLAAQLFADVRTRADRCAEVIRAGGVYRVDRVRFDLDAPNLPAPIHHKNGWVDVWGIATRSGVFMYRDGKGRPFPEYRPPSEVHDAASLDTLVGVPFTIDHPANMVDSRNARDLVHGVVLETRSDGRLVPVKVRLFTEDVKKVIDAGTIELSCGYTAQLVDGEGVSPEGEPFKATQTKIVYNHLALVDRARAGHIAALHLDAKPSIQDSITMLRKLIFNLTAGPVETTDAAILRTFADCFAHSCKAKALDASASERADLETAGLTIEMEGEKPVSLILPMEMVMSMVGMLGVSGGEAPAPEDPAPPVPGAEDPAAGGPEDASTAPPVPGAEPAPSAPAAVGTPEEEEEDKAKGLAPKFNSADREAIGEVVESVIAKAKAKADAAEALRADARAVIGESYDPADKTDDHVRLDVAAHVLGNSAEISRLRSECDAGNAEAALGARVLFAHARKQDAAEAEKASAKLKDTGDALAGLFAPKADADETAKTIDPRDAMIARQDARSRGEDIAAE